MDVISRLVEIEVLNKKIDTYQMNGATSITHLVYVDDVLIFTKVNYKSLNSNKITLETFVKFSGFEVNSNKSSATYSRVCKDDQSLHNILAFSIKKFSISYLGLSQVKRNL